MANAGGKAATTTRAPDHGATVPAEEGMAGGKERSTALGGPTAARTERSRCAALAQVSTKHRDKTVCEAVLCRSGFVCLDALAGRITHSSKLERLIR